MGVLLIVAHADAQGKKLPPLIVDTDAPLLLDSGNKERHDPKEVAPSVAANADCYVCHENYRDEMLVRWHADEGIGCIDCHGESFAHKNDENNTTPPDVMFPLKEIDASCQECHETHDVPAMDVVARLQQQVPRARVGERIVCTQCHGSHRLDHRTVVWDRVTRRLLTGSQEASETALRPKLDALKRLAGTWVAIKEGGATSDQVVAHYRITAAGSAVVETLFPGTEQEMVTIYHQDGDDLFLTRYGTAQNQPRMKSVPTDQAGVVKFEFVDGTNMQSLADRHMHSLTIKMLGPDHVQTRWQGLADGLPDEVVFLNMIRKH